ncbi:MAG: murein biosynthesis integral membrane protein MurJ [Armatimonadia bacterium]|nr:murein biosynthesis integral membrane protein MurJ [Armatimonadia bacterium]
MDKPKEERTGRTIAGAASVIALMHLSARAVGFVEQILRGKYFGTSHRADAYEVASKVPATIFYGCEKILNPSFIPSFIDMKQKEGEGKAWQLAGTTLAIQAVILTALVLAGRAFSEQLVQAIAPGFYPDQGGSEHKVQMTVNLMRIVFIAVFFLGISSTTYCILNAFKRFATPALGDVLWKVGTVAGLLILYGRLDVYAIALGFLAGAVLKLGTHVAALGRWLARLRIGDAIRHPIFKRMLLLMLPMAFGFAYSEARQLFDIRFASELEKGAVAALNYPRRVTDLPYQIVAYALGIALFPFLSEYASSGRMEDLKSLLLSSLRMLVFMFVPVTVALFVLAEPTIRVIYQAGEFDENSVRLTTPVLEFYALGMLAQALECVILQTFYSLKNTLVPTIIGFSTSLLHIGLAWWFVQTMSHTDPRGLALAYTLARSVKVVLAFVILAVILKGPSLKGQGGFVLKIAGATATMAFIMYLVYQQVVAVRPMEGRVDGMIVFMACAAVGAVVYLGASWMLRVPEVSDAVAAVRKRLRRRKSEGEG